ncbi:hypothetical protein HMPREF1573_00421 [Gardnerella vaginalis JCP7276]|nr:hypothetical protein HMPREF1573_00421 [Gardnerella vaginalis JCP7276]
MFSLFLRYSINALAKLPLITSSYCLFSYVYIDLRIANKTLSTMCKVQSTNNVHSNN